MTNIPMADRCLDAVISLHTVYHIPKAEQTRAVGEAYRLLRPGGKAVIVYSWKNAPLMYWTMRTWRRLINVVRRRRKQRPELDPRTGGWRSGIRSVVSSTVYRPAAVRLVRAGIAQTVSGQVKSVQRTESELFEHLLARKDLRKAGCRTHFPLGGVAAGLLRSVRTVSYLCAAQAERRKENPLPPDRLMHYPNDIL